MVVSLRSGVDRTPCNTTTMSVSVSVPTFTQTQQKMLYGLLTDVHRREHEIYCLGEHKDGFYPCIPVSTVDNCDNKKEKKTYPYALRTLDFASLLFASHPGTTRETATPIASNTTQ
jgi:hypothetical protein